MENFLTCFNLNLEKTGLFSYFSCETFCLIGVLLNLFFYIFFKRKDFAKRFSDILTIGIFSLNILILVALGLFSGDIYSFDFSAFIANPKIILNIFFLLYLLITYKIARKTRIKTSLLNAILLTICLSSCLMVQNSNFILTFALLDLTIFFIYKYASSSRIRKDGVYSREFILTSTASSILFYSFCITSFFIKDAIQLSILDVCTTIAILLKIGIFPIYNYLNNRNYKSNLPYSILLFVYLPFVGIFAFNKMISKMSLLNEVFQITILSFAIVSFICFAFFTIKQKNIVKFLAGASYCFACFSIINILFIGQNDLSVIHSMLNTFAFLGIFSLLCILKINYYSDKINLSAIRGIFITSKKFAVLFAFLLLIISNIIPSAFLKTNLEIVKNMYVFDNLSVYFLVFALLTNLFITFNSFVIIKNCYTFDKNKEIIALTKRTTLNYVVPFVIICFLLITIIL